MHMITRGKVQGVSTVTLQHTANTATHCNTLQHTALQHTATHCNTLQQLQHTTATNQKRDTESLYCHNSAHYNTLQHAATHCNTLLQHTRREVQRASTVTMQHTTTHCIARQSTATHCCHEPDHQRRGTEGLYRHTATHYNKLQHNATHCNTLLQRTRREV